MASKHNHKQTINKSSHKRNPNSKIKKEVKIPEHIYDFCPCWFCKRCSGHIYDKCICKGRLRFEEPNVKTLYEVIEDDKIIEELKNNGEYDPDASYCDYCYEYDEARVEVCECYDKEQQIKRLEAKI